jgi:ATP adenylyltransferase
MNLKPLWAPWRMEYIQESKQNMDEGCLFCRILEEGKKKARENLVVAFRPGAFVIMNRYPYTNGHIMVVPEKHAARLSDFSRGELTRLFTTVREAERVLFSRLKCEGLNVGINLGRAAGAGIDPHLHVQIVPRWVGDTNFMTVFGEVRVIPQHIKETCRILRRYFNKSEP